MHIGVSEKALIRIKTFFMETKNGFVFCFVYFTLSFPRWSAM